MQNILTSGIIDMNLYVADPQWNIYETVIISQTTVTSFTFVFTCPGNTTINTDNLCHSSSADDTRIHISRLRWMLITYIKSL